MRPGREIFISALRGEADDTLVQAFGVGPGWGLWRAVQLALEGLDIGSRRREILTNGLWKISVLTGIPPLTSGRRIRLFASGNARWSF
jgi:hypothetical protein